MPALNQLRHLAVEKRQQQGSDMGAVHIGVGHDNDAVIAQLIGIEIIPANTATQCRNQGTHLLGLQHLVEAGLFHIQDLALERQDSLSTAVPPLFRRTARRVALDQKQLGQRRVLLLTVGQLARQTGHVQSPFAPRHLAGLAGRLPGSGGVNDFGNDDLGFVGMLQQEIIQLRTNDGFHCALDFRGHQLVLRLRREFRIRQLH